MNNLLQFLQISTAVLLIIFILLQSQGTGLGNNWSGGGETYHTKRGVEKVVFILTGFLIVVFAIVSITNLFIS